MIMPHSARDGGPARVRRFRTNRPAAGMKLLRVWVPAPNSPEFITAACREAEVLRGAREEQEALDFIEVAIRDFDDDA